MQELLPNLAGVEPGDGTLFPPLGGGRRVSPRAQSRPHLDQPQCLQLHVPAAHFLVVCAKLRSNLAPVAATGHEIEASQEIGIRRQRFLLFEAQGFSGFGRLISGQTGHLLDAGIERLADLVEPRQREGRAREDALDRRLAEVDALG